MRLVGLLLAGGLVMSATAAESPESGRHRPRAAASATRGPQTLREGTQLKESVGRFRMTGDRVSFHPVGESGEKPQPRELFVLENLLLDRITSADDFNTKRLWRVSGLITQYRGANYLLLTRAVAQGGASMERKRLSRRRVLSKEKPDEKRPAERP